MMQILKAATWQELMADFLGVLCIFAMAGFMMLAGLVLT
jgi:hypothetical protein